MQEGYDIIGICLLVCVMMLIWIIWKKQIIALISHMLIGIALILMINHIIPSVQIGINGLTVSIATLLGIPGVISLYILKIFA